MPGHTGSQEMNPCGLKQWAATQTAGLPSCQHPQSNCSYWRSCPTTLLVSGLGLNRISTTTSIPARNGTLSPNRRRVIGANIILHLHNGLYHDWGRYEGIVLSSADTLVSAPFLLYKQATQLTLDCRETPSLSILSQHQVIKDFEVAKKKRGITLKLLDFL
jgi:hypothetical protein